MHYHLLLRRGPCRGHSSLSRHHPRVPGVRFATQCASCPVSETRSAPKSVYRPSAVVGSPQLFVFFVGPIFSKKQTSQITKELIPRERPERAVSVSETTAREKGQKTHRLDDLLCVSIDVGTKKQNTPKPKTHRDQLWVSGAVVAPSTGPRGRVLIGRSSSAHLRLEVLLSCASHRLDGYLIC